jgi:hypothetical protein
MEKSLLPASGNESTREIPKAMSPL